MVAMGTRSTYVHTTSLLPTRGKGTSNYVTVGTESAEVCLARVVLLFYVVSPDRVASSRLVLNEAVPVSIRGLNRQGAPRGHFPKGDAQKGKC